MTNVEIASTIVNQLGGNKFTTMTGSKNYMAIKGGVRMDLTKNRSKANRLEITLDGLDLYTMRFYRYTSGRLNKKTYAYIDDKVTEIKEIAGVYNNQLQSLFRTVTGLDTHL